MGKKQYERFDKLYGIGSSDILNSKKIIIFGVGGVGSFAAEALIRSGIGHLTMVDPDLVEISNLNRQLQATHLTIGSLKVEAMKERLITINPDANIIARDVFFDEEISEEFDFSEYDYIIDAIDSVKSKILLIEKAKKEGSPIISSMGAGNKKDPTAFKITDISKTKICPLARIVRKAVRELGLEDIKVVWSEEIPTKSNNSAERSPGSSAFVPSVAGLIIASEVVSDLLEVI